MHAPRANSSLVAVFFILLVIAGVIYLFWQNMLIQEKTLQANTAEKIEVAAPSATPESLPAQTPEEAPVD